MNVVNIDGFVCKVASSWDELTKAEVKWLCRNMQHLLKPSHKFRIRLMLRLLKVKWWRFKVQHKLMNIPVEQIAFMGRLGDWVLPIEKIKLTKNFFKYKRILFFKHVGPSNGLQNLSLEEFSFADHHFRQYMATQNIEELNKLCAVLWRLKGPKQSVNSELFKGDERVKFNSFAINKNSERFKYTSLEFRFFVLFFYWGCRNTFVEQFSNVFSSDNENTSTGLDIGWISVMFELAGNKFGNLNETGNTKLITILLFLENSILTTKTPKNNGTI